MSGDAVIHKPGFGGGGLTSLPIGNSAEQNQKEIWPEDPEFGLGSPGRT